MGGSIYMLIVVVVTVVAIISGYRRGFVGQIASILGLAFGIVAAHILQEPAREMVSALMPGASKGIVGGFAISFLAGLLVYVVVFAAFRIMSSVLRQTMKALEVGMLDSILGSLFAVLSWLMVVSIFFNLILCLSPRSKMVEYADADDGNLVQIVLLLAPTLLGTEDVTDLSHRLQLQDAKKISQNRIAPPGVNIITQTSDAAVAAAPSA